MQNRSVIVCTVMLLAAASGTGALAQAPADDVHWTVSLAPGATVRAGDDVTVEVLGTIDAGWHVYGLTQLPNGPTPLRLTLDTNDTAAVAGPPSESTPQTVHDPRFGLDTQFHTHLVTLHLPVHLAATAAGNRVIPVSVRYQLCSEGDCKPPRVVHLSVSAQVGPGA